LKRILRPVSIAILGVIAGCDPGMTIRQAKQPGRLNGTATLNAQVKVDIETKCQLIGQTLYGPKVKVTNLSGAPIAITSVELAAIGKTYANTHPRPETFPLTIQSGSTETLHVLFRLDEPVHETFHRSAELLIHCKSGEKLETVRASLIGGRLEATP